MEDYMSNVKKNIPYQVLMTLPEYIEFQLRLIFGKEVSNFSKGELQVLSYLFLFPEIKEAINKIIEARLRTSRKSVFNDISKFKTENIVEHYGKYLRFNQDIIIYKDPNVFEINVNLNELNR